MGEQGLVNTCMGRVVATRAYRVLQQQGYLGFEESARRDFAKLGGQSILKVMKDIVQAEWRQGSVLPVWSPT